MSNSLLEKCGEFHGHTGPGIMIGYRASEYVKELLEITENDLGEIVCVAENISCSLDAIEYALHCTIAQGTLFFRKTGKNVYTFFNRKNGKSIRIALNDKPELSAEKRMEYLKSTPADKLFSVSEARISCPKAGLRAGMVPCEACGELTAENMLSVENDRKVCKDCCESRYIIQPDRYIFEL